VNPTVSSVRPYPEGGGWARRASLVVAILLAAVVGLCAAARHADTSAAQGPAWSEVERWTLPPLPVEPLDIALAPDGRLWVADGRNGSIAVVAPAGNAPAERLAPPAGIAALSPTGGGAGTIVPFSVVLDAPRDRLYVLWAEIVASGDRFRQGLTSLYIERRRLDGSTLGVALRRGNGLLTAAAGMVTDLALAADGELIAYVNGSAERLDPLDGSTQPIGRVGREGEATRLAVLPGGDLIVASPWSGQLLRYTMAGELVATWPVPGPLTPRALAVDAAGLTHVLLGGDVGAVFGTDQAILVTVNASGTITGSRSGADLRVDVPAGYWPFALSLATGDPSDGLALVTGEDRLRVARVAPAGSAWPTIDCAPAAHGWAPRLGSPDQAFGAGMAVAAVDGQRLVVLDHRERQVVAWDRATGSTAVRPVPPGTLDVAAGSGTALFAVTGSALMRLDDASTITPTWAVSRTALAGTRIALGTRLYATDPRGGRLDHLDPATGRVLATSLLVSAAGLWPADVAAAGDAAYTADLLDRRLHAWTTAWPDVPVRAAPSGLVAGPRRLAAGRLADGTPALAALLADGYVEILADAGDSLRTIARFRPDGGAEGLVRADDIALDPSGRVLLADSDLGAVRAFAPQPGAPAPTAPPPPSPTPADGACAVRGDKRAGPARVVLGETAIITLSMAATCPARARVAGADIVLVMDRSGSMSGDKLLAARRAATTFLEPLDTRIHQVAVVSFADGATLDAAFGSGLGAAVDALAALRADGGTNVAASLATAMAHLEAAGRPDALPVIVLATDGHSTAGGDPTGIASAARAAGIVLYAIGIGVDVDAGALRALAGAPERTFLAARPGDLYTVYEQLQRLIASSLAGNLVIVDAPDARLAVVPGSARPAALETAGTLGWGRTLLPTDGITLTYAVRPLTIGRIAVGRAVADYVDADGAPRRFAFPEPVIEVVAPTASPTRTGEPTPRPTMTRTPRPLAPAFLPVVASAHCMAATTRVDVALVIDASQSMAGGKLAAARAAAADFVALLDLRVAGDRAAVIAFDAAPRVLAPLTADRQAIATALDAIAARPGTRIDLALRAASGELAAGGGPGRRRVIVLLSDGAHGGPTEPVVALADRLRQDGVSAYAIGLGGDADALLLRAVAGPGGYFAAPSPDDLAAIYARIAAALPCR